MSVTPGDAPVRPAYVRDSVTGLYYRLGGGGAPEVFVQAAAPGAGAADILWLDIDDTTTQISGAGVKITVSNTEPIGAIDGDLWVDTS